MKTIIIVAITACLFGSASPVLALDTSAPPNIHNYGVRHPDGSASYIHEYNTPGSLESTHDLDCIGADQVKNKYTPADLYKAVAKCVTTGRYEDGAFLFQLAGVYGRFDARRVEDKTAHQAITALIMATFMGLDQDKKITLSKNIKAITGNPEDLATMCKEVERIGPPDYFPRYMIQHGMTAIRRSLGGTPNDNGGDGLVKNFDAKTAWQQSLASYLHCPGR